MKRSRRNHSPAFKAKVALQAIRGDKTLSELAQQHQVHATQIGAWKQQCKNRALVGLGSYIVNAVGGCNDCHTWPNYEKGGDPLPFGNRSGV